LRQWQVLNESGQKLVDLKMEDFGAFVLANLSPKSSGEEEEKEAVGPRANAAFLVDQFVATFPGFDDHYTLQGEEVYLLKRAQLAVACIHRRFKVRGATARLSRLKLMCFMLHRTRTRSWRSQTSTS
jgi:hypothetical protein